MAFLRSLVGVVGLLISSACVAHDLGMTSLELVGKGKRTHLRLITPLSRLVERSGLSSFQPRPEQLDQAIRRRLALWRGESNLQPAQAALAVDSEADLLTWESDVEGESSTLSLRSRFYPEDSSSRELVTVSQDGGSPVEVVLDANHPSWNDSPTSKADNRFVLMFVAGIQHILGGLDHILFVLGLTLLGGSLRSLLGIVTAFTVAHCTTLTLAALGLVQPSPRLIEPLIALSIVAIATENLRERSSRADPSKVKEIRPWIAFGFGLVHGFGFAGGLAGLNVQGSQLLNNLLSFNVGVEVGQALILLPAFWFGWLLARRGEPRRVAFATVGSIAIGLTGSVWFVERLLA